MVDRMDDADAVFKALADPTRRALLDQGCRPWQSEIVAPLLVAAFEQFPG